jgi:steroid delta-isomerase-like uncharacterized protein
MTEAERGEMEALLQREAQEVWTAGNEELIPLVYADNHDQKRRLLAEWREAFPDFVMQIDDIVIEGDRAAVRYTISGTHLGVFQGHEPTGETFRVQQIYFVRIEDGKIAGARGVWDKYGFEEQLGFLASEG